MSWTISDTVIVALIGGATTVLGALIKHRWSQAAKPSAPVPREALPAAPTPLPTAPVSPPPVAPTKPVPQATDLSFLEIVTIIDSVPPFHRDSIENNYRGLRVRWSATLQNIYQLNRDLVSVAVTTGDGHNHVSCEAEKRNVLELLQAREKAPVKVEGTIKHISTGYAELGDCVITLAPADVTRSSQGAAGQEDFRRRANSASNAAQ